jgi:cyclopropane fatty-acyl-phospholipid synthase-like methyltransferase
MSDNLYTFVGNRDLLFANPLSEATVTRAIDVLPLRRGAVVADFGAGFCELPVRLVEKYDATVTAIELSPMIAQTARLRVQRRLAEHRGQGGVTVHEGDAGKFRATIPPSVFDLSVCIGSTQSLGGYQNALTVLIRLTKPGGLLLIGEMFWKREPTPTFLQATGMHEGDCVPHHVNSERAIEMGLTPLWIVSADEREFDEYEWAHARAIEHFAGENADMPETRTMLERSRAWRNAYLRWGRHIIGFGLYLFRTPGG